MTVYTPQAVGHWLAFFCDASSAPGRLLFADGHRARRWTRATPASSALRPGVYQP